jgi:hypothetical protein
MIAGTEYLNNRGEEERFPILVMETRATNATTALEHKAYSGIGNPESLQKPYLGRTLQKRTLDVQLGC